MALLDDVATFLASNSITGGATGWTAAISFLPDTPDKVVYFKLTGSIRAPEPDFYYPTLQFIVRGEAFDPQPAITKANALISALDNGNLGSSYPYTFAEQNMVDIGADANNRPMFSINFKVMETK